MKDAGNKPCDGCPWLSKDPRDKAALKPEVRQAAKNGNWFCCHVKLGTCHGAVKFGAARTEPLADFPRVRSGCAGESGVKGNWSA